MQNGTLCQSCQQKTVVVFSHNLQVLLKHGNASHEVWSQSGNQGNKWRRGEVFLGLLNNFQVSRRYRATFKSAVKWVNFTSLCSEVGHPCHFTDYFLDHLFSRYPFFPPVTQITWDWSIEENEKKRKGVLTSVFPNILLLHSLVHNWICEAGSSFYFLQYDFVEGYL